MPPTAPFRRDSVTPRPEEVVLYTFSGTTNGARYFRRNIALASWSPTHEYDAASNFSDRPSRYEMLARCTSVVEIAPSSIGAFRSSCLRDRTAAMKFAQLFPLSWPDGPGACSL